jgi:hypothetical protein
MDSAASRASGRPFLVSPANPHKHPESALGVPGFGGRALRGRRS